MEKADHTGYGDQNNAPRERRVPVPACRATASHTRSLFPPCVLPKRSIHISARVSRAGDGKPAPVFSDKAMEAISKHGNPTIDEETGAMPIIYGADKKHLEEDKVEYVIVGKDEGITTIHGEK